MGAIDNYLAAVKPDQRAALTKLRKTIRAAAPKAEEYIGYGLAAFRLDGKPLVAFGASKKHCAFYPMNGTWVNAHKGELEGRETSKGTIRFQPEDPLPTALVRKIVKERIAENGQPRNQAICDRLHKLIDAALPKATSKVWHGSPVWFVGENPVVGTSVTKKGVQLLFWNGRAIDKKLEPVGKYGAAEAVFADAADIDAPVIRRWLKKAGTNVFDSKAFFKKLRGPRGPLR
jgi:uncharacterized protein YdhG (YjbR/CyaY superfamily)